jgi:hypothetical protein
MSSPFEQPSEGSNGAWNDPAKTPPAGEVAIDQTFATGAPCRLAVDNPRGLIRVAGWDRPDVHVQATKLRDSSPARFAATRVVAEQQGNTVQVRTVVEPGPAFAPPGVSWSIAQEVIQSISEFVQQRKPAAVAYEIRVPRRATLDLKCVSADVDVKGVEGDVRTHTVSGNAELEQVTGDVQLQSVSGNLAAQDVRGRLEVNTVSGDVNLLGTLDAARMNSVSGSFELAGPLNPTGSYDFHSVSGGVTLRVPPDTRASIAVRGVSADVAAELPAQVVEDAHRPGQRTWRGLVNGGGAAVNLQTVSARLRLIPWKPSATATSASGFTATAPGAAPEARPEAATSPSPTPPLPTAEPAPAPPEPAKAETTTEAPTGTANGGDQMAILRALERGELSVDEALKRLEALRGGASS